MVPLRAAEAGVVPGGVRGGGRRGRLRGAAALLLRGRAQRRPGARRHRRHRAHPPRRALVGTEDRWRTVREKDGHIPISQIDF